MDLESVFRNIHADALAIDLLSFVEVRSETGSDGPGSEFLGALLRREGFDVELDPVEDGRPNVYARIHGARAAAPSLLINGHTDTIPVGQCDPAGRQGDYIAGRGSEDMKGGLVAMVHAASALRKAGVRLSGDLWLTGVVDHETPVGKKRGPRLLIDRMRNRIHPDAVLIAEGPPAIWSASLGSTIFTVTIRSRYEAIHTIKVPYSENPACWLGRLLVELEDLEGLFVTQAPHPLCGRESINVGIVTAGDYFNRLPTIGTVTGTWRWGPGKAFATVQRQFEEVCDRLAKASGLEFSVCFEAQREPFETPREHPLVQALLAAGRCAEGVAPDVIGMALVGDANLYVNDGGVATVYYGPAHETAHSDHERVSISRLVHCARVYAATAMNFCAVEE